MSDELHDGGIMGVPSGEVGIIAEEDVGFGDIFVVGVDTCSYPGIPTDPISSVDIEDVADEIALSVSGSPEDIHGRFGLFFEDRLS